MALRHATHLYLCAIKLSHAILLKFHAIVKNINTSYFSTVVAICMNKQSRQFCDSFFYQRYFARVKRQHVCEGNLNAYKFVCWMEVSNSLSDPTPTPTFWSRSGWLYSISTWIAMKEIQALRMQLTVRMQMLDIIFIGSDLSDYFGVHKTLHFQNLCINHTMRVSFSWIWSNWYRFKYQAHRRLGTCDLRWP